MSNKETFNAKSVVAEYAAYSHLQAPEQTILNLLKDKLPQMTMLDIGVGGGRTTVHFAPLAKRYIGADYAPDMVAACRERFKDLPDSVSFDVADARSMPQYSDGMFDLVLFSFNGIDGLSPDDRAAVFREIKRITKPGGHFVFSTHNLQNADSLFRFPRRLGWNPIKALSKIRHWYRIRHVHNTKEQYRAVREDDFAVFNDGAHNFQLKHYYIRPAAQIRELKKLFKDVRVFSLTGGGKEITEADFANNWSAWIYYLCTV